MTFFHCENIQRQTLWTKLVILPLLWQHSYSSPSVIKCITGACVFINLMLLVTGLCEGNSPVTGEIPAQRASNAENTTIWWRHHDLGNINDHVHIVTHGHLMHQSYKTTCWKHPNLTDDEDPHPNSPENTRRGWRYYDIAEHQNVTATSKQDMLPGTLLLAWNNFNSSMDK